jgi:hypothetical protein
MLSAAIETVAFSPIAYLTPHRILARRSGTTLAKPRPIWPVLECEETRLYNLAKLFPTGVLAHISVNVTSRTSDRLCPLAEAVWCIKRHEQEEREPDGARKCFITSGWERKGNNCYKDLIHFR